MLNLVLDLDDTLYLEEDYVRSGLSVIDRFILNVLGISGFFEYAWGQFLSGQKTHLIDQSLPHFGIDPDWAPRLIELYRTHCPKIQLLPDSISFLKFYAPKCHFFLLTDGRPLGQWLKIEALQIASFFKKIIVTGDQGPEFYKPCPWAYKEIQKSSSAPFIYIADNPNKDFTAPLQLGWNPSIRIKRKQSLHYSLLTPPGVVECQDLSEALLYLESQKV